jgi:hypothetical protein
MLQIRGASGSIQNTTLIEAIVELAADFVTAVADSYSISTGRSRQAC